MTDLAEIPLSPLPSPPGLRLFRQGPAGWLVIDRPRRRNALTLEMWEAVPRAMRALGGEPGLRVVLLRGAGREAFCAGADISQFSELRGAGAAQAYEEANLRAFAAIADCPLPVIAMIHGHCVGGGLGLALACDMRIAARGARFAIPPARLGLAYPLEGLRHLLKAVTPATAKEMIFTARALKAKEALQRGLVNAVHPGAELKAQTLAAAARIAAGAPLTIDHAKAAIDAIADGRAAQERKRLAEMARACENSRDYREGVAAFAEKRKPRFRGE